MRKNGLDIRQFARDDEVLSVLVLLEHRKACIEHVPALDHRGQVLLVDLPLLRAANPILFPTFAEEDDGGNPVDPKRLVDLGRVVDVELDDLGLPGQFGGEFVDDRVHFPAGHAPGSSEVHQHGQRRLEHLFPEVRVVYVGRAILVRHTANHREQANTREDRATHRAFSCQVNSYQDNSITKSTKAMRRRKSTCAESTP